MSERAFLGRVLRSTANMRRVYTPLVLFSDLAVVKGEFKEGGELVGGDGVVGANAFFCVDTAEKGLQVYRDYFEGRFTIGPTYDDGFVII